MRPTIILFKGFLPGLLRPCLRAGFGLYLAREFDSKRRPRKAATRLLTAGCLLPHGSLLTSVKLAGKLSELWIQLRKLA